MNIVKATMSTYKSCKKWLSDHDLEREYFVEGLSNAKGISYEYQPGGIPLTMDMKNSINSDKIAEWDREHARKKALCESVVTMCDEWIKLVPDQYQQMFDYWMKTDATYEWISRKCSISTGNITKQVDKITLMISNQTETHSPSLSSKLVV